MRARTPPAAHPAPNNVGMILLFALGLAIVAALALVGPGIVEEIREMAYCMAHPQESVCAQR